MKSYEKYFIEKNYVWYFEMFSLRIKLKIFFFSKKIYQDNYDALSKINQIYSLFTTGRFISEIYFQIQFRDNVLTYFSNIP
jgi:hypothetical protein